MTTRTIKVDYLARVEGEGAFQVRIKDRKVEAARLAIFEPPRFFEAFLRGRAFTEAPDLVARICGICPVAYQMSAVQALESALGLRVEGALADLRRLLYCGEWIASHVLHIVLLHAPDFLGYDDGVAMAKDHPQAVERGLRLKKAGNEVMRLVGGREIHPVNVRVGGFYRIPARRELAALRAALERALEDAIATARWVAGFEFPALERPYEFVALHHGEEYPMLAGRLRSSAGLDAAVAEFDAHFEERQVSHSTALHSHVKERGPYLAGPLARFNLNHALLAPTAGALARAVGLEPPCRNPFRTIVVRAVEVVHACEEALRLVEAYEPPERPSLEATPRAGVGYGCTEAPRGLLYHRYELDGNGTILDARIVPPTSQNLATIEDDLREVVEGHIDLPDSALQWRCEQAIRNHDPCISCATHFLRLEVERA
jgi:coenzyme F420-reducing hydrogenase alpha subunit